jgi:hypothetical protein
MTDLRPQIPDCTIDKFGGFLVYRMFLNENNKKRQEKFYEVGPVSAQSDMFFGPKSAIFKHIQFSFGKTYQNKKRFKNRMKSPQSQSRVKTILRLLYIPRPFQRYQLCSAGTVPSNCMWLGSLCHDRTILSLLARKHKKSQRIY